MTRRKSTIAEAEATKDTTQAPSGEVTLVGRLVADPVLHHTKSGKPVSTIRIAVNAPDSEPTFHSVVVWNRTAEVVCEYLRKGRLVEVVGRSQQRSYQAADGTDRTVDEISAFRVAFLSGQGSTPAGEEQQS
jgi:single-strand DNA-binding protein